MLPPLKKGDDENDSWKWTLRYTANRPVLRFDGDSALIVETQTGWQPLKGTLALMAGAASEGYGSAIRFGYGFQRRAVPLPHRNLGLLRRLRLWQTARPTACFAPAYVRKGSDGWNQSVALMVRRFSAPDTVPHGGALEAIAMSYCRWLLDRRCTGFPGRRRGAGDSIPRPGRQCVPSFGHCRFPSQLQYDSGVPVLDHGAQYAGQQRLRFGACRSERERSADDHDERRSAVGECPSSRGFVVGAHGR